MNQSLEELRVELQYDKTNSCVQCGYCLPVCPTYATMGVETHSPRGRINLVKMAGEGKITDLSVLEEPLDLCLGCRACETACPTGVEYGVILEAARSALVRRKKFSAPVRALRTLAFRKIFPSKKAMKLLGNSLWLYQKSGMQKAARATGIINRLPYRLGDFEAITPDAISPAERRRLPERVKAKGERKYTIAFFTGCIMDAMFQRINRLSVLLLAEAGCDVIVMPGQTCCGALHAHAGEMEEAKRLARRNITVFEREHVDFIVNNAGGCGAMLYEYGHLLSGEEEWAERAALFSNKSKDISQVLAACGGLSFPQKPKEHMEKVTYQHSCHLTNVQKVTVEPLELLASVPGTILAEMDNANMCCGSAGIYNIVHHKESMEILDVKMEHARATQAATIITTNPGCLLQMKLGIEREKLSGSIRAIHLVEYLAEAAGLS
jgi:glycolate oxidase iron-sulfur subunit